MKNKNQSDFDLAHTPAEVMLDKVSYQNKRNILHNNLNENLLSESIQDYNITINSDDRTVTAYPNLFKFTTVFGGFTGKSQTQYAKKDDYRKITFNGQPGPAINRRFKNVKYVRLNGVILPTTNKLVYTDDTQTTFSYSPNPQDQLRWQYGYVIIRIKEITSQYNLCTNNRLGNDCFRVYADRFLGGNHSTWIINYGLRTFLNSNLGTIERLTTSFLTPQGEELQMYDPNGVVIDFLAIANGTSIYTQTQIDSLNALNPYSEINFILGIFENELSTDVSYS